MWGDRRLYLELADVALKDKSMQITCAECGKAKGVTNGWFIAWPERKTRFCFDLLHNDPAMAREEGVQALCGENCLIKAVVKHAELMRISQ